MHIAAKQKVVVLGTMTKMPVAGIVFITVQYLIALGRASIADSTICRRRICVWLAT